jgi:hypothetical protein
LDVESKVKNFTFISTYIEFLLMLQSPVLTQVKPLPVNEKGEIFE